MSPTSVELRLRKPVERTIAGGHPWIYRDALLMGKFLAAMATIAVVLLALWLVTTGLGIYVLGIPPGGEEVARGQGTFMRSRIRLNDLPGYAGGDGGR